MRNLAFSLSMLLLPALVAAQTAVPAPKWALAIHGGAGTIPKNLPEAQKQQYLKSLTRALEIGRDVLKGGGTSLDAVEKVVRFLEDDPLFNAGKGAVYTHEGTHELDAGSRTVRFVDPLPPYQLTYDDEQGRFPWDEGYADADIQPRPGTWRA